MNRLFKPAYHSGRIGRLRFEWWQPLWWAWDFTFADADVWYLEAGPLAIAWETKRNSL